MRPQIVPIFHREQSLDGSADLGDAGQHAVGKNVFGDPGVAIVGGFVAADGVQQQNAFVFKAAVCNAHERSVIFPPDMFEHTHGNDFIEPPLDVAVVAF